MYKSYDSSTNYIQVDLDALSIKLQLEDTGQRWFWYYIGEIDIAMIKSPQKC